MQQRLQLLSGLLSRRIRREQACVGRDGRQATKYQRANPQSMKDKQFTTLFLYHLV